MAQKGTLKPVYLLYHICTHTVSRCGRTRRRQSAGFSQAENKFSLSLRSFFHQKSVVGGGFKWGFCKQLMKTDANLVAEKVTISKLAEATLLVISFLGFQRFTLD